MQLNLFGGSVANLGNDAQRSWLEGVFSRGELGSFLLTERGAGVLSGLIVETEARYDAAARRFDLHSPSPVERSAKYWISQGYTARWGVVIARLLLPGGEDRGPHAFVVDLQLPGVHKRDMAAKTVFNSLDNCEVWFDHVALPADAMLSGVSYLDEAGLYRLRDPAQPFSFYQVAQRLLSGRICLSWAALERAETVVARVAAHAAQRLMPVMGAPGATSPLLDLPSLRHAVASFHAQARVYRCYLGRLSARFADSAAPISPALVHEIACAKILVVEFALAALADLKARVGAYSLMRDGAFDFRHCELLYLIRFAEGDSGILAQKMARDTLRSVSSAPRLAAALLRLPLACLRARFSSANTVAPAQYRLQLDLIALALKLFGKSGQALMASWLAEHDLVERIARKAALMTVYDVVAQSPSISKVDLQYFAQLLNLEK